MKIFISLWNIFPPKISWDRFSKGFEGRAAVFCGPRDWDQGTLPETWQLNLKCWLEIFQLKFVPKLNSTRKLLKLVFFYHFPVNLFSAGRTPSCLLRQRLTQCERSLAEFTFGINRRIFGDPKLVLTSWRFIFTNSITNKRNKTKEDQLSQFNMKWAWYSV